MASTTVPNCVPRLQVSIPDTGCERGGVYASDFGSGSATITINDAEHRTNNSGANAVQAGVENGAHGASEPAIQLVNPPWHQSGSYR